MALDQIAQAVLDAARTEADHIAKAASKNVNDKLAAARRAADQEAERRFHAAARAIEEELARKVIQLQGAGKKALLGRRNALLKSVFDKARGLILALPAEEYASIMGRLLHKAAADCGGKLRIHPSDTDIFSGLVDAFNQGRPENLQISISLEQPLSDRGGFIFVSDVFQVDQTLGALIADIEYELAPKISVELFSGQK